MNMILCCLLGIGLLLIGLPASAAELAGTVASLQGQASATTADSRMRQLATDDPVYVEDTLEVEHGARLDLRLNDGSQLLLQDNTQITLADYLPATPQSQINMTYGNLRAVVGSTFSRRANSFKVKTATAIMGVQGTDFRVLAQPTMTQVKVYSGVVAVTSSNLAITEQRLLRACEGTDVELNQPPQEAVPFKEEAFPPLPPIECAGPIMLPAAAAGLLLVPPLLKALEDNSSDNRLLSPE